MTGRVVLGDLAKIRMLQMSSQEKAKKIAVARYRLVVGSHR